MAPKKETPQIPKTPPAPGETVKELCERLGKEPKETVQAFIERLVYALEEASRTAAIVALDRDEPGPTKDMGPILSSGGALDAENQALELVHYVSGMLSLRRGGTKGIGILVDRASWTKLRHRVDMLLGIPSPGPEQTAPPIRHSPTLAAAELRARLMESASAAFKSTPKGDGTIMAVSDAAIRAVCWAVAQELTRPPQD